MLNHVGLHRFPSKPRISWISKHVAEIRCAIPKFTKLLVCIVHPTLCFLRISRTIDTDVNHVDKRDEYQSDADEHEHDSVYSKAIKIMRHSYLKTIRK